jgi:putative chitobiose transport system permease protein
MANVTADALPASLGSRRRRWRLRRPPAEPAQFVPRRLIGQRWWTPYLFMLPGLALFGIFFAWPAVEAVELSFYKYDGLTTPTFIGWGNFTALLHDPRFWSATSNSLIFVVGLIPFCVVLPLFLAVLVNQKLRGIQAFRVMYYLPVITSTVAISVAWGYVFHQQGVINWALTSTGLLNQPVQFLLSPHLAIFALILVEGWRSMGTYMMIYLAGLQAIPSELYEAATVDGAGAWARFRKITAPLIVPYFSVALTLEMLGAMQVFTTVYVMTRGGPEDHTLTLGYYIWSEGFQNYNFGYASAMGVVLWVVLILMALFNYRLTRGRMVAL